MKTNREFQQTDLSIRDILSNEFRLVAELYFAPVLGTVRSIRNLVASLF